MSKAVLTSIKPKRCEDISNDEIKLILEKTRPKIKTPFKCYIYCTYDRYNHLYDIGTYMHSKPYFSITNHNKSSYVPSGFLNGKVIGEFICNDIVESWYPFVYAGWYISDLKIYDEPKELSEFGLKRAPRSWCYVEEI